MTILFFMVESAKGSLNSSKVKGSMIAKLLAEPLKTFSASANQTIPTSHEAIKKRMKKNISTNLRLLNVSNFEKKGINRNR